MPSTAQNRRSLRSAFGSARRLGARAAALAAGLTLALACATAGAGGEPPAESQKDPNAPERRVKARYLYKFAGYVDWPESAFRRSDSPITLGVLGDDQLAAELARLVAGHRVDARRLAVRRIDGAEQASGLHILFIGRAEAARLGQVVRALPPNPMLVVTESQGALERGSTINFIMVDGRVRFEISLAGAQRRGIKLSSRLLAVAHNVRKGTQ